MLLHNLRGIGMHIHHILCVGNLHALREVVQAVGFHTAQNLLTPADKHNLRLKFLRRAQSAQYDLVRRVVAAHCVNDDLHACCSSLFRPVIASICASARSAMARFLFAFPLIRCSSGAMMPKLMFIGWKLPMELSLI